MLKRFLQDADHIFIACGATDFRKGAQGLSALISLKYQLDPYKESCVFIFCSRRKTAVKVLRYDRNGFILASKKLLDQMKFPWPKTPEKAKEISFQQGEWLLSGLEMEQVKAHHAVEVSRNNSCF